MQGAYLSQSQSQYRRENLKHRCVFPEESCISSLECSTNRVSKAFLKMNKHKQGGVIGYGSLINPDEFKRTLDTSPADVAPSKCNGYRRMFNNEATWREMEDSKRAVLNVTPDTHSWINGILLPLGVRWIGSDTGTVRRDTGCMRLMLLHSQRTMSRIGY